VPIPVPTLDDRTFDDLIEEGRALIPRYFPPWTDHNASDPGIALLELFAFVIEAAIYQIDRVPERSLERFVQLVGTTRRTDASGLPEPIETTLRRALEGVRTVNRSVTDEDLESLARTTPLLPGAQAVGRANAVVRQAPVPNVFPDEQTVELVVVPLLPDDPSPRPLPSLRKELFEHLNRRRLITTRLRVVEPQYTAIEIEALVVRSGSTPLDAGTVQRSVEDAVRRFLSPLEGGTARDGWEFGRSVYRSEIYQVIEGTEGVDHVHRLLMNGDEDRNEVALVSGTAMARLDRLIVEVTGG